MREHRTQPMSSAAPRQSTLFADTMRMMAVAALLGGVLGLAPIGLGNAQGAQVNHLRVGANAYGVTQHVEVGLNKSLIIDLPADVNEVIVSQPTVAGAIMRNKRRAIIQGTTGGDTNIFFLDRAGEAIAILDVSVLNDSSSLSTALARALPGSRIEVQNFGARIVLSGTTLSQDDSAKALLIAEQFAGTGNVASIINVSGAQQVMLQVTVAEVNREAVKQLGINLSGTAIIGSSTIGMASNQPLGGASNVITNNGFGVSGGIPGLSINATLKALERNAALRTLAEPNLTAMSGQEAEFLAGGEFPVPTDVADNKITYSFKEFGVKLKFTPTVKSNGIIGLVVDTSVSEPTTEGGFAVGGITIPATKNRQARTTVELGAGETLAIAGLMQDSVRQQINKMPGLGDIPILGALFRSRDFIHSKTELVILVTPYLAQPGPMPELPTDGMVVAGDAEAIFLGRMESMYGVGPGGIRGSYNGSVGFVLD